MHKTIPLSKVRPNPFRKMNRYPISEEKITMLVGSMGRTGFWDNVVGREYNNHVELAYGHHRWMAFKQKFGKKARMNLIIRDLSDEDMLRIMADENANEYGTSAEVEQETIRAVVEAYADGKIELPKPQQMDGGLSSIRNAPSFLRASKRFNNLKSLPKPYNATSIAKFLGWMCGKQVSPRVRNALAALEAIEEGLVPAKAYDGLTSSQAEEIAREAVRISRSYEQAAKATSDPETQERTKAKGKNVARRAASRAAKSMRPDPKTKKSKATIDQVKREMQKSQALRTKTIPSVEKFALKLTRDLDKFLGPRSPRLEELKQIAKHRDDIRDGDKKNLTVVLKRIIDRCQGMIDKIEGNSPKLKGPKSRR